MREKVPVVLGLQQVVVVAVIKIYSNETVHKPISLRFVKSTRWAALLLLAISQLSIAAVLPEDRADALYHSYDGGGIEVNGPSIIVRKKISESVSISGNYYVDSISSASIDVVTTASPYSEERVQNSVSVDFLSHKTLISAGYTTSVENDFDASTFSFNMSQDMFGDLTNIGMGVSFGSNIVTKTGDTSFEETMDSRGFHISLSQVVSKNIIISSVLEVISDEGFLNNPYRSVRYEDSTVPKGYSYQSEVYPNTRTSNAFAVRAKYHLPSKSAIGVGYRTFNDSWGIQSDTYELSYQTAIWTDYIFELSYRAYSQTSANFYKDLFPFINAQEFLARDKELSTFKDTSIGFGISYDFLRNGNGFFKKGKINFNADLMSFEYADFKDLTSTNTVSTEPLYTLDANVYRVFISLWF